MISALTPDTKITLLMGGPGSENEISRCSGEGVLAALREEGFRAVTPLMVTNECPEIPADTQLCYNIIHGSFGEDGGLQAYLQERGFAYTGAGVECSRNCFDKVITKQIMLAAGVPTPASQILTRAEVAAGKLPDMGVPCVIKPPKEGSSVGVHIVKEQGELAAALADAAQYGEEILVEAFISGRELTVSIIDGKVYPVVRICPREGFYDMRNKYPSLYSDGGTDYICPADLTEQETQNVQAAALAAYQALKVEVYGRVDVLLDDSGQAYVLEINTIPGMTSSSLLPKSAAAAGLSYGQLCTLIAELSLKQSRV